MTITQQIINKAFGRMNDMQKSAVFRTEGPLLIIAGAGSGKTTVLINRIANMILFGNAYHSPQKELTAYEEQLCLRYLDGEEELLNDCADIVSVSPARPWQILAITFTNKAANELKERLSAMLGEGVANDVWASTFHSCCAKILRRYADRIGFETTFTIYDTDDTKKLIKDIQKQYNIDDKYLSAKFLLSCISDAKNKLLSPADVSRQAENGDKNDTLIANVYESYQKELKKANAMDFDDLIMKTVELLESCEDVREYYQRKFKYVMVDEYQDTNFAQFKLTQLLSDGYANLCVVGDDDQSIYAFRGATIENILSFERLYPDAKVIRLEQNYRSTQNILDCANEVIAHNNGRMGKNLWTSNGRGELVSNFLAADERDEADYIARTVNTLVSAGEYKYSDFAILYRANAMSRSIEMSLSGSGIPYKIFGGRKFYDRAEIRDMIAYLTIINNPSDNVKLSRIINVPKRGIGNSTIEKISQIAEATGTAMFDVICHADEYEKLRSSSAKLLAFAKLITGLIEEVDLIPLNELFEKLIKQTDYIAYLESDKEKNKVQDKISNINELLSSLVTYQEENEEGTLQEYLEEVSLYTDMDTYEDEANYVTLMTMHSAKGLEFPVVFLPGFEETVFPGIQSMETENGIEEERRLAYVAITRAKQRLHIINAATRASLFGGGYRKSNLPSRFLNEIPDRLLDRKKSRKLGFYNAGGFDNYHSSNFSAQGSSSARKQEPAVEEKIILDFTAGQRVLHPIFGQGTVLNAKKVGNDCVVDVAFDDVGTKKLLARTAKMKKI